MKRLTYLLLALAMPLLATAQKSTANDVLSQFLWKIDEQTLSSDFVLTVTENTNAPISYSGKIQMRGEKFRLSMLSNEGAYDGKTYYLYSEETDELTLTTPTHAELLEANPILFSRALQRQSAVKFSPTGKDAKHYVIELIPNNVEAGVMKFVIKLQKSTLLPVEVTVKEHDSTTVIRFKNAKFDAEKPAFVITPKPGTFVNDLR
jgi:outer membrane lipoprotein-sorting protein